MLSAHATSSLAARRPAPGPLAARGAGLAGRPARRRPGCHPGHRVAGPGPADGALVVPEWTAVRSKPQHNPVHRFTVDRHLVEAAVEAAAFTRRVARPDLLLLGAAARHRQGGARGPHRHRSGPARGVDRHPHGIRAQRRRGPRPARAPAPTAPQGRHQPGSHRPRDAADRGRRGGQRRDARAAPRPDRSRLAGHRTDRVVTVAGGTHPGARRRRPGDLRRPGRRPDGSPADRCASGTRAGGADGRGARRDGPGGRTRPSGALRGERRPPVPPRPRRPRGAGRVERRRRGRRVRRRGAVRQAGAGRRARAGADRGGGGPHRPRRAPGRAGPRLQPLPAPRGCPPRRPARPRAPRRIPRRRDRRGARPRWHRGPVPHRGALVADGLDIRLAKIATLGHEVVDTFYVVDARDGTRPAPESLSSIEANVVEALRDA